MNNYPPIHLHNTLSRQKEPLQTSQPDQVTMYVCGPTVYNYAHIGNARPAVVFDTLSRLLRHDYSQVTYARNFTDVDDKINAAAAATGVAIDQITNRYIDAYHEDMQSLGILPPELEPRVTNHIPDIIALIETLIEKGHAYCEQEHVLFHVPSYTEYGQLSGRRVEDMLAGARVDVAPYKRDPMDFVLWKPSTPDLPGWDSPWGRGRPGWHIECSAMINQHFGQATIDIHGGGQDLIFPHHENEIAQGTCAHDSLYCRTWVHNSFVTVDGQKMSKSLGNVLLVRDLLDQAPGEAIKLALLSTHYRKPLDWNDQRLSWARETLTKYYDSLSQVEHIEETPVAPDDEVMASLRNDLNVPGALARLHVLLKQLNEANTDSEKAQAKSMLLASAGVLGLLQASPQDALTELGSTVTIDSHIEALTAEREQARQDRDFAKADALRKQLEEAGFLVKDTPTGPVVHPVANTAVKGSA